MDRIEIALTKKQQDLMAPLFAKNNEEVGMIIGQFFDATDGTAFFVAGYADDKTGQALQEAIGECPPGKVSCPVYQVFEDVK